MWCLFFEEFPDLNSSSRREHKCPIRLAEVDLEACSDVSPMKSAFTNRRTQSYVVRDIR